MLQQCVLQCSCFLSEIVSQAWGGKQSTVRSSRFLVLIKRKARVSSWGGKGQGISDPGSGGSPEGERSHWDALMSSLALLDDRWGSTQAPIRWELVTIRNSCLSACTRLHDWGVSSWRRGVFVCGRTGHEFQTVSWPMLTLAIWSAGRCCSCPWRKI